MISSGLAHTYFIGKSEKARGALIGMTSSKESKYTNLKNKQIVGFTKQLSEQNNCNG
jgi:hypothetical protein